MTQMESCASAQKNLFLTETLPFCLLSYFVNSDARSGTYFNIKPGCVIPSGGGLNHPGFPNLGFLATMVALISY